MSLKGLPHLIHRKRQGRTIISFNLVGFTPDSGQGHIAGLGL
jgi:hypothetical protein